MQVKDILEQKQQKGRVVVTIDEGKTLQDAVELLVAHNIGALVAVDGKGAVRGILTERDVLRESASRRHLHERRVGEMMSKAVVTGTPDDSIKAVQRLMLEHRIRHLPIVEGVKLVGIVSMRDLVSVLLEATEAEANDLRAFLVEKNVVS